MTRPATWTGPATQESSEDIDLHVPLCARRNDRPGERKHQHEVAKQRINPQKPGVEEIPQQDLQGGQEDHGQQQGRDQELERASESVLDASAVACAPHDERNAASRAEHRCPDRDKATRGRKIRRDPEQVDETNS